MMRMRATTTESDAAGGATNVTPVKSTAAPPAHKPVYTLCTDAKTLGSILEITVRAPPVFITIY